MKKLILFELLFFVFTVMCFAKGSFELFGGMPLNWENFLILR